MRALVNLIKSMRKIDGDRRNRLRTERLSRRRDQDYERQRAEPQVCGDCRGGGTCAQCAGRAVTYAGDGQRETCFACGGSGRCQSCGGGGRRG